MKTDKTVLIAAGVIGLVFIVVLYTILTRPNQSPNTVSVLSPTPTQITQTAPVNATLPENTSTVYKTDNFLVRIPAGWNVKKYAGDGAESVRATPENQPDYPAFTVEVTSPAYAKDFTEKLDLYQSFSVTPSQETINGVIYYKFDAPIAEDPDGSVREKAVFFLKENKMFSIKSTYDSKDSVNLQKLDAIMNGLVIL